MVVLVGGIVGTSIGLIDASHQQTLAQAATQLARDEGMLAVIEGAAAVAGLEQLAAAGVVAEGSRVVVLQAGHPANYA